jgi:hypothetical protein
MGHTTSALVTVKGGVVIINNPQDTDNGDVH